METNEMENSAETDRIVKLAYNFSSHPHETKGNNRVNAEKGEKDHVEVRHCNPKTELFSTASGKSKNRVVESITNQGEYSTGRAFIQSLPVVVAQPETSRISSVHTSATEIVAVTHADRILSETADQALDSTNRPAFISVRIYKESADNRLGISFRSAFGELVIGDINLHSPVASSPLRRGDRVVKIDNHRSTSHWTAVQAAKYVREKEGFICIVAQTKNCDSNAVEATVYKSSGEEKLGISFRNDRGRLRIKNIATTGLIGDISVLHPGDFVLTINGVNVTQIDSSLALEIIRTAVGVLTIRATSTDATDVSVREMTMTNMSSRRFSDGVVATADEVTRFDLELGLMSREHLEWRIRPCYISVKVHKPTYDTKLGITFSVTDDDQLQISSVVSQGMLGKCSLAPGLRVLSIGHVRCIKWTAKRALEVVKATVGELLFVLHDPGGNTSYAMAMAYKSTPRSKIGISFKSSGQQIEIGDILPDGIFFDSVLNKEDVVISINNVPCERRTPSEAVAITQRIPESVIVLVKLFRSNCIVLSHQSDANNSEENESVSHQDYGPNECCTIL